MSTFLMEGSSCHLVVGKGSWAGTRPQQRAVRVGGTRSTEGHNWVGRSGETQSTLGIPQKSGCHVTEIRAGIIPNNIYSYSSLSAYGRPRTMQVVLCAFNLLVLPAAPWEDGNQCPEKSSDLPKYPQLVSATGRDEIQHYLTS